jgi:hypothetical protein
MWAYNLNIPHPHGCSFWQYWVAASFIRLNKDGVTLYSDSSPLPGTLTGNHTQIISLAAGMTTTIEFLIALWGGAGHVDCSVVIADTP